MNKTIYEDPGKELYSFGNYIIVQEKPMDKYGRPQGNKSFSVWGPDYSGRYCRISRHRSMYDACVAAEIMAKETGIPL